MHVYVQLYVLTQIHFGETSMQKCEIMLNDLIDSKRTNTNIKATMNKSSQTGASLLVITFLFILAIFFGGALKGREKGSNLRPQT